jgi:uncharacterized protein
MGLSVTKRLGLPATVFMMVLWSGAFAQSSAPVFAAVKENDIVRLNNLLQNGADPNSIDEEGDPLLLNAVLYSSPRAVELLLSKKADPNAKNKDGETALMWAMHDINLVKLLLKHGADPNAKAMTGNTPLLIGVVGSDRFHVVKLLLDHGANPLAKNNRRETALLRASIFGDTATLSLLAAAGNDVDAADTIGATPLIQAIFNVNRAATVWLLDNGADPDKVGIFGLTAVSSVVTMNDLPSVEAVLKKAKNVNVSDTTGVSALMWAVYNEHDNPTIVQALLERGADVHMKTKTGETALTWALRKGNTKTVALLRRYGAQ